LIGIVKVENNMMEKINNLMGSSLCNPDND
jgi:hypothetical protein